MWVRWRKGLLLIIVNTVGSSVIVLLLIRDMNLPLENCIEEQLPLLSLNLGIMSYS
jgi:hypothetical protein